MKKIVFYKVTVKPTSCEEKWFAYFLIKPSHSDLLKVVCNAKEAAYTRAEKAPILGCAPAAHLKLMRSVYDIVALLPSVDSLRVSIAGTQVGTVNVDKIHGFDNTGV